MTVEYGAPDLRRGFPLVKERDDGAQEAERARLREIDARPGLIRRWQGYWKLTGPGWLQSAITLGAGSAGSTILAGAAFGYKLLWVNPLAMFLGVVVFAAVGRQTLLTHARPYDVFRKRLHPALALFWGLAVLSPRSSGSSPNTRSERRFSGISSRLPVFPFLVFQSSPCCSLPPRRSAGATAGEAGEPSGPSNAF
jgi:hypothetical protein